MNFNIFLVEKNKKLISFFKIFLFYYPHPNFHKIFLLNALMVKNRESNFGVV